MGVKLPIYYSPYRKDPISNAYSRIKKDKSGMQVMQIDFWNKSLTTYIEMFESYEDRLVEGIMPTQTIKLCVVDLTQAQIDGVIIEWELVWWLTPEDWLVYAPFDEVIPPETDISVGNMRGDVVHLVYAWIMSQTNFNGITFAGSTEHP